MKKRKNKARKKKPTPTDMICAALLDISVNLGRDRGQREEHQLEKRHHDYTIRQAAIEIEYSLSEIRHELRRLRSAIESTGIANAIYTAVRELKPPPSVWVRWKNRLQMWWWNRKLLKPAVERVNLVADALEKHEQKIKDGPSCGRW